MSVFIFMLSWIEIDRSAIVHNLKSFRHLVGPSTLLIPVVKANAYGHGILEVAQICEEANEVDRLATVNLDEALMLRIGGVKKPIQVLSFFELNDSTLIEAAKKHIILPLYTLEQARFLNKIGEKCGLHFTVHLKIDTGTSRVGVLPENILTFYKELEKLKYLKLEGLWSHFSSSETDAKTTKQQYNILMQADEILKEQGVEIELRHMACSAASLLHPFSRLDAVRLGLSLYGMYPAPKAKKIIKLRPALSWKSTVIQVKEIEKGTKVSYGGTHTMDKKGTIAVVPIGYYDGYDRAWSNKAEVLVKGQFCKVLGRICMNLMMIDVSKIKNVKAGDVVTLLGKDGKNQISADDLANLTPDTINYEITTRISPLLPRSVI